MKERVVNVCGQAVGVGYCMATEQGFEELAGKSIHELDATRQRDVVSLAFAAMVAYYRKRGEDVPVKMEGLLFDASPGEMTGLLTAVAELRAEWYAVPLEDGTAPETVTEGGEKN